MDVRDQALHVDEAVEPGNQFLNCYQKTSSDGCSTMFLVFFNKKKTSLDGCCTVVLQVDWIGIGLDWYWMDILTSGANVCCWNWNYTIVYYI